MTKPDPDETTETVSVDALLAGAASRPERPSDALFSRVLTDAQSLQPRGSTPPVRAFWQGVSDTFGGWRGMSGLAAATCAGLWIGVSAPAFFPDATVLIFGEQPVGETDDISDLLSSDWTLDEGFDDAG